jgi:type III restriction enzyme
MALKMADYQVETVEKLTEAFLTLWKTGRSQQPIVLKSPTGSGKTFMLAHFVKGLNHIPTWDDDKAFIWITFSEELALQSRDKFELYFGTSNENGLLTVENISQGSLQKNDILFLNWQKLVSKSAENRKLRRPDDARLRKEQGGYFEDFVEQAKLNGREIVLVIDEAHTNVTPVLAQEIIDTINPRVTLHVTATPKPEIVATAADLGTYINVDRSKVVAEGLIKEKIVIQTHEDLEKTVGKDFDHALLDLGLAKRNELKRQFVELGKDINPLLLIQLPNDDSDLVSMGEKTKEQVVVDYLESIGVAPERIGRWFDNYPKPEFIEDNNDKHDILIFKLAAGTGWDCPRAQVLVMFRNIKVEQRYVQTVGRILRSVDPSNIADYSKSPDLRAGYLYTNYHRQDIVENWIDPKQDSPLVFHSKRRITDSGVELASDFLSRIDYGDLSSSSKFQMSFMKSMDDWFLIDDSHLMIDRHERLEASGLDLGARVTNKVIADAQFENFDQLSLDFKKNGIEVDVEMSTNDIEKTFNLLCWSLLKEQTEEDAKIANIARSWSPLKSAFRVWLRSTIGQDSRDYYRIVIADLAKGASSVIRPAVTKALKDYRPVLDAIVNAKANQARISESYTFSIAEEYSYPANYEKIDTKLGALENLYVPGEDFGGKKNELEFVDYLEAQSSALEWWFKQGVGRDYFGVYYFNTSTQKPAIFYPDWILKLKDGRVLIVDTKGGRTASDTEGRAEGLAQRMQTLGDKFVGGIVLKENGVWHLNSSPSYSYTPGKLSGDWKLLQDILSNNKK